MRLFTNHEKNNMKISLIIFLHLAPPIALAKPVKKQKKDNNLYEIEVTEVDRKRKLVRIHYKGYDSRFDEW